MYPHEGSSCKLVYPIESLRFKRLTNLTNCHKKAIVYFDITSIGRKCRINKRIIKNQPRTVFSSFKQVSNIYRLSVNTAKPSAYAQVNCKYCRDLTKQLYSRDFSRFSR